MLTKLIVVFTIPLVLSLFVTPFVIRLARWIGAMDEPNERKIHKHPIPRLGGVGIYFSFFAALLISLYLAPEFNPFTLMNPHLVIMLVISLTIVLAIGIWDDIRPVTPGRKFLGQCIAASIVYFSGFRISAITHPFNLDPLSLGFLEFPATILWIVGITNAFNLIDGLDGLASGVALIVSLTISMIAYMKGDVMTAMMAVILAGAVLGFLRYNFNGAKIFLGDSGSLFIGFLLAILSMQSSTKGSAAFSLIVPVLALGLPIMDTLLSMTRRMVRSIFHADHKSKSFLRRMVTLFLPDRGHIHHQLIARGYSDRKAVIILYIVSCLFGIGAFAVTATNNVTVMPVLVTVGVAMFIGVSQLRYKEMAVLRNGTLLPLYRWPVVKSSIFQGFLDLAFIIVSFLTAKALSAPAGVPFHFIDADTLKILTMVCGIRLAVFYMGGMYKWTFDQLAMGDLLRIFKTTTLAVVLSWLALMILPDPWNLPIGPVAILDFYFLISLVLGARISFHILKYISRRGHVDSGKKKVLIYGADTRGIVTIQQILNDESLDYAPVGFIDDDPQLEGKFLDGYPVFGGHWKLQKILQQHKVDLLIISKKIEFPEILKRIRIIARSTGTTVRRLRMTVDEITHDQESQLQGQYSISFTDNNGDEPSLVTAPIRNTNLK